MGECIKVPEHLLLQLIRRDVVISLSQGAEVSKMLWGLTYFYIQPDINNKLKRALRKNMIILFVNLESILEEMKDSENRKLGAYVNTLVIAALWLNIDVNIDDFNIGIYSNEKESSRAHKKLLAYMRRVFHNEIIESEKGVNGLSPIDILISRCKLRVEVQGPVHYGYRAKNKKTGWYCFKK